MNVVLCGNLGAGKTLGMSILLYMAHMGGFKIYANYEITGYPVEKITNSLDLKILTDEKKFFGLDEFWIDIDSRQASKNVQYTRKLMQLRKRKITALITSQSIGQLDNRMRSVIDLVIFPVTHSDAFGYPVYVDFHYTTRKYMNFEDSFTIRKLPSFTAPVIINGFNVAENYDTYEIMEEMGTEDHKIMTELVDEYMDWESTKTDLKSKLIFEHGLNSQKALALADYIFYKKGL